MTIQDILVKLTNDVLKTHAIDLEQVERGIRLVIAEEQPAGPKPTREWLEETILPLLVEGLVATPDENIVTSTIAIGLHRLWPTERDAALKELVEAADDPLINGVQLSDNLWSLPNLDRLHKALARLRATVETEEL